MEAFASKNIIEAELVLSLLAPQAGWWEGSLAPHIPHPDTSLGQNLWCQFMRGRR